VATATPDPNYQAFLSTLKGRTDTLAARENAPVTASAERATDLANRDIFQGAAGARKAKSEELASRGLRTDVGAGAGQLRAIDEAAQTRSARAASDIGLAREKEQDTLNAQREAAVNALYGMQGSYGQVPFSQSLSATGLAQQGQQNAEENAIKRAALANQTNQSNISNWLSLMNAFA
jgi:hypothetical protein